MERPRFFTLDALRGIAAIIVVFFHCGLFLGGWVPRFGYLAVDLFFLLSGFVVAHAYDQRLLDMSPVRFMWLRARRLYPLYVLGLVAGAAAVLATVDFSPKIAVDVGLNFAVNLLGLPSPASSSIDAPGVLYPLNISYWSLFFEFWAANLVYAVTRKIMGWRGLLGIIGVCALGLLATEKMYYTLSVGGVFWPTLASGFARVGFSYFSGVAIFRWTRGEGYKSKIPGWYIVAALLAALCLPLEDRAAHLFELVCVMLIFPALVLLGAGAVERGRRVGAALGEASYALYTIHFPVIVLMRHTLVGTAGAPNLLVQVWRVAALVVLAWWLGRVDTQVRKTASGLQRA